MTDRLKWRLSLAAFSFILAVLLVMPQFLHTLSPFYKGISVYLNSDEAIYLARVEESLTGRPEQAAEAFTGHPNLIGTQDAFIEKWYGILFRFTGWRAPTLLNVMDGVVPVLVFLSLVLFFQLIGFRRWPALLGAAALCLIELYSLGRPIHMRASFLLMLWSLIGVLYAVRGRWWGILLGGWLLGLLIGVYLWSFTFAWAYWGIYFVWELSAWKTSRTWKVLGIVGIAGILFGIPAIMHHIQVSMHPLYDYGVFRSGMHHGRSPESWPYAILFFMMVLSVCIAQWQNAARLRPYRSACVLILAACVYMNQQMIHGIIFNFVSHGILSLATAAIVMILLFVTLRMRILALGAVAACIYLAAIGYDGRYVLGQWKVEDHRFTMQHLASALPALDAMPRGRILSDPETQAFIAAYTHHDIVYSVYLKNILMTHSEIAMRLCMSFLPLPPELRHLEERHHLIYPDAVSAFGVTLREEELQTVLNACKEADIDPASVLQMFEVTHIFWNKKIEPQWDLTRLHVPLTETASGDGWILYEITSALPRG